MFMPVTLLTPNTTIRTVPSFTHCHASTLKRAVRVETFSGEGHSFQGILDANRTGHYIYDMGFI